MNANTVLTAMIALASRAPGMEHLPAPKLPKPLATWKVADRDKKPRKISAPDKNNGSKSHAGVFTGKLNWKRPALHMKPKRRVTPVISNHQRVTFSRVLRVNGSASFEQFRAKARENAANEIPSF